MSMKTNLLNFFYQAKNFIKRNICTCLLTFLTGWLLCALLFTFNLCVDKNQSVDQIGLISYINRPLFISSTIILALANFILYRYLFKSFQYLRLSAAASLLIYFLYCLVKLSDFRLSMCLLITYIVLASAIFRVKPLDQLDDEASDMGKDKASSKAKTASFFSDPKRLIFAIAIIVASAAFTAFVSVLTILRVKTFISPNFDQGLFTQMFYYMRTHATMQTTLERDELLSHMSIHFSPAFWLALPFYAILPKAETLLFAQAFYLGLASIPLAILARRKGLNRIESFLIVLIYLTLPAISGGCFYDIHENMFLPLFIFSLLLAIDYDKNWAIGLTSFLTLMVKEDAAVYVIFIALYMIFCLKKTKKGLILFLVSSIYFIVAVSYIDLYGAGTASYRFNNMLLDPDDSLLGIFKTIFYSPFFIFTQAFDSSKSIYIAQTFLVYLFLPLMTKKTMRYLLILPYIIFNVTPEYPYLHNIFFQYTFGNASLLLYLALINIVDIKAYIGTYLASHKDSASKDSASKSSGSKLKDKAKTFSFKAVKLSVIFLILIAACTASFFSLKPKTEIIKYYQDTKADGSIDKIQAAIDLIPKDASVSASTFMTPKLADRDTIYETFYTDKYFDTDYVILDLRYQDDKVNDSLFVNNPNYDCLTYEDGLVALFKKKI